MSNMSMFPEGYFYILSRKHGFALDVYDGQTKVMSIFEHFFFFCQELNIFVLLQQEGANLIVWPQKFQDSDNQ